LRAVATPGHAAHHVSWLDDSAGTLVAGDVLGILLAEGAPLHPATPPPGVDLVAWDASLAELSVIGPERAVWSHFGVHGGVHERVAEYRDALGAVARRVAAAVDSGPAAADEDAERFDDESRDRLRPHCGDRIDPYFDAFSPRTDYAGVRRFIEKNPDWSPPRGD
jgi:glyoxylase-like metal-dependent hydrolase (beta-lactamase superfamily II)